MNVSLLVHINTVSINICIHYLYEEMKHSHSKSTNYENTRTNGQSNKKTMRYQNEHSQNNLEWNNIEKNA